MASITNNMKTVQRTNAYDKAEGREAGVTIAENGQIEMAAAEGVDIWWENGELKAGRLTDGATIEEWTTAAGMAWTIRKSKVRYYGDRKQTQLLEVPDQVVLSRSDNGAALGIVGADYNVVQPYEVLEFFRNLVAGSGFKLTTAGTLFGGKRMWALAKITEAVISGWDTIGGYLLLSTSADGSTATEARKTTVCVVCRNTLRMATAAKAAAKVSHRMRFDSMKLQGELGLARDDFMQFIETANDLSKIKVSDAAAEAFVMKLLQGASASEDVKAQVAEVSADDSFQALLQRPFVPADVEIEDKATRKPRGFDPILALFEGEGMGALQKGRAGTAWGLVNAVTEYVDHHATAKSADHRIARAWYGTGDALKSEALTTAIEQFL